MTEENRRPAFWSRELWAGVVMALASASVEVAQATVPPTGHPAPAPDGSAGPQRTPRPATPEELRRPNRRIAFQSGRGTIEFVSPDRFRERTGAEYVDRHVFSSALPEHFFAQMRALKRRELHPATHAEWIQLRQQAQNLVHRGVPLTEEHARALWQPQLVRGSVAPVVIGAAHREGGLGVFARASIRRGQAIGVYFGLVRVFRAAEQTDPSKAVYAMKYDDEVDPPAAGHDSYTYVVDATKYGNEMRLVNHARSDPNVGVYGVRLRGRMYHVLVAERDIPKGEQLFYDYGHEYWESRGGDPETWR